MPHELSGQEYKILYAMELRFKDMFSEAREQSKQDVSAAIAPIYTRLGSIEQQLEAGNQRFQEHTARMDGHSDIVDNVQKLLSEHLREASGTRLAMKIAEAKSESKNEKKSGVLTKLGTSVGLPLLIAVLSPLASIWVMIQLKMIAFADQTQVPGITQPNKP